MGDATKTVLDFLDFPPFRITFKLFFYFYTVAERGERSSKVEIALRAKMLGDSNRLASWIK